METGSRTAAAAPAVALPTAREIIQLGAPISLSMYGLISATIPDSRASRLRARWSRHPAATA